MINLLPSEEETRVQFTTPSAVYLHKLEQLQQQKCRIIHSQSRKYPVGTQLGWAVLGFRIFFWMRWNKKLNPCLLCCMTTTLFFSFSNFKKYNFGFSILFFFNYIFVACILISFHFFCCEEDNEGSFESERQVPLCTFQNFLACSVHHHSRFLFYCYWEHLGCWDILLWSTPHSSLNICSLFFSSMAVLICKKYELLNSADDFQEELESLWSKIYINPCLNIFLYRNN